MTDELERNIGRDLQFIRVNGTLVGGLVGLAIYIGDAMSRITCADAMSSVVDRSPPHPAARAPQVREHLADLAQQVVAVGALEGVHAGAVPARRAVVVGGGAGRSIGWTRARSRGRRRTGTTAGRGAGLRTRCGVER